MYGKGGTPLDITARIHLTFSADGKTARIPVFIQPSSEQECLLGSNVLSLLGVTVHRASGELLGAMPKPTLAANVQLVRAVRIPGRTGVFAEVEISGSFDEGEALVFEHDKVSLAECGLMSHDSLVTVKANNKVLVPLTNQKTFSLTAHKDAVVGTVSSVCACEENSDVVCEDCVEVVDVNVTVVSDRSCADVVSNANVSDANVAVDVGEAKVEDSPVASVLLVGAPRSERLLEILSICQRDLSQSEYDQVIQLVLNNCDVFALDDSELGCTDLVKHDIDTSDSPPIKQHFCRVPFVHRQKITQIVNDMLKQGIIRPSKSAWASPIVLVPKKDGNLRFCIDYRKLNSVTKKDQYPLPRIEDILDAVGGMHYFSTLDLASGYWQIEMRDEASQKSAFATHCGLHEFVRMPFGLCNAPATFQRLMEVVLSDLLWNVCFVYIDDILVCSCSIQEPFKA